jgi:putative flippase GtrA
MATLAQVPALHSLPQAASLVGILAGLLFNYGFSRYVVFHKRDSS